MFHDKCGTLLRRGKVNGVDVLYCPKCNVYVDTNSIKNDKIVFTGEYRHVQMDRGEGESNAKSSNETTGSDKKKEKEKSA